MNPRRTDHTTHLIAPAHLIIVRRVGGRDLWTVEENHRGRIADLVDGAIYTDRAQADLIADAYVATRTHHPVQEGAR